MAVAPENTWVDNYKAQVTNTTDKNSGINNLTNMINAEVNGKLVLAPPVNGPSTFTWQSSIFKSALQASTHSTDQSQGAKLISDAWAQATEASQMVLPSGFVGSPSPATTWSAPPVVAILPPSVQSAKASLFSALQSLAPTKDESKLPIEIRKAFLLIKFSVTGINSVPPPTGPQPLVVPSAGVQ